MAITKLLIANRGEIAIRIARAAGELGIETVTVHSEDDANSLHARAGDHALALRGEGVRPYLDIEQLIAAAKSANCDAVHPGYGFLSENAEFARRCGAVGLPFVGPRPEVLELFGDKARARALAHSCRVPVLRGTQGPTTVEEARGFFSSLKEGSAIVIKAIAGGGGRGIRIVRDPKDLEEAYARCQSEARAAFGNGEVYVESFVQAARHIEVQVLGDSNAVTHLFERDCTLQRRHQKIVEIAPSPRLAPSLRDRLTESAVRLALEARLDNLATIEFLVDGDPADPGASYFFIEANPRLQVEHTITEEITAVDLVKTQLSLASGKSLKDLALDKAPLPRGVAIQLRINMETMSTTGEVKPSAGTLQRFEIPSGPGVRVDSYGYVGYTSNPQFDSLLAKLVVHSQESDYSLLLRRAHRALSEFHVEGVETNIAFLDRLITHPSVAADRISTRFVEDNVSTLVSSPTEHRKRFFEATSTSHSPVDRKRTASGPGGTQAIVAPLAGKVVSLDVKVGDAVPQGTQIAVLEAMKMEHIIVAGISGYVRAIAVTTSEVVFEEDAILYIEPAVIAGVSTEAERQVDLDFIRPDLAESIERHAIGLDERRPEAVARRRKTNQRTTRENIEQLCDPGSFIEYGALTIALQRRRRPVQELIRMSPADGMVTGIGSVNGALFGDEKSRCLVMAYDYTVLAGTQGGMNHKKKDRLLQQAEQWRLPVMIFAEGGGGRPGDTDAPGVAGLDVMTFHSYAKLSGLVPRVGIVSGRCFAGNAALLGCSDVIIATKNSNIGMGGPAMIEGGGLGVFAPEEVGPVSVQAPNGVIDVLVDDEIEAVDVAKKYLSYFQGSVANWKAADQRILRQLIPENRLRIYDVRRVIAALADEGSVLELRRDYALGMITAFVRIDGRPMGLIANNPIYLAGAIDAQGSDKAARFFQLCDAFGLPILSLCDTPGFMVGPDIEKEAHVRRTSRMFVTAATMSVPVFTIVLRKGYGLGAQAMAGGSFHAPFFIVSWPTGEFGGMGLEGAVKLGYRKELEAIADPQERDKLFKDMVARSYERGKAINMASYLEIDEVIDPADTRRWISRGLRSLPKTSPVAGRRRTFIDTW